MRYLFSFKGRISRSYMWTFFLIAFAFMVAIRFALLVGSGHYLQSSPGSMTGIAATVTALILAIVYLVSFLAVCTTRLHDRNKGAIWLVPFVFIPSGLQVLDNTMGIFDSARYLPLGGGVNMPETIAVGFVVWGFVELYCLRGTHGPNDYGPDPLD